MDSCDNHIIEQYYYIHDVETTNKYALITVKRYEDLYGKLDDINIDKYIEMFYK
jgi:hypothetical protein